MSTVPPRPSRCYRLVSALVLGAYLSLSSLFAQSADATKKFSIPAGPAETTLKTFSQQSGHSVVFASDNVRDVRTIAVTGELTPSEALSRLLTNTGLIAVPDEKTSGYFVRRQSETETKNGSRAIAEASDRPNPSSRFEIDEKGDRVLKLDTFEVLGSKLLNMDIRRSRDDAQPYVIFDRDTIEHSGATDIDDFLKNRLPMNTVGQTAFQKLGNQGVMLTGSTVNLRGLGANQTLILVDGRRVPETFVTTGFQQADLTGIPLSAIERIEVLPTTASGIYGGSATGGVVNVVLRRDYAGVELKLSYENTFDTDAAVKRADLAAGVTLNGTTNILFSGSLVEGNTLAAGDRGLFQRGRAAIVRNNPATIFGSIVPPSGGTPNIRSQTGANLTLRSNGAALNSPFTFVPVGYAGASSDGGAGLIANAGKYNLDFPDTLGLSGMRGAIVNPPKIRTFNTTIRHQFSDKVEGFLEGGAARNIADSISGTAGETTLVVPATLATNPFNEAVYARYFFPTATTYSHSENRTSRLGGGFIFHLPGDWKAETDLYRNDTRFIGRSSPSLPSASVATLLANGTIDLSKDPRVSPIDVSSYLVPGLFNYDMSSRQLAATVRVGGPVAQLPAGPASLSALVEYRDLDIPTQTVSASSFVPARGQQIQSAYLETTIPLFSKAHRQSGAELLEVQVAGRFDRYRIDAANIAAVGATPALGRRTLQSTNPTLGLRYQPLAGVTLRASYGTGFLPPDISQLVPSTSAFPTGSGLFDPRRGNQSLTNQITTYTSGGNPNLRPELSKSWSGGVVFAPPSVPGLRLSIDYTNIRKSDNISDSYALFTSNFAAMEAAFPSRVVRGPNLPGDQPGWAGPITSMDFTLVNISRAEVEAYDVQLDYSRKTESFGTFDLGLVVTEQTHYVTQLISGAPRVENVGITSSFPLKVRGNARLSWKKDNWSAGWTARYFDSYVVSNTASVIASQGGRRVPSQIFHDVFVSYRFRTSGIRWADVLTRGLELQLGVNNVFNTWPALDMSNTLGYYSYFGSPLLRTYRISLKKQF